MTDRGASSLELALGAGLLLMPVVVLVLSLPTWVERQSAARLAAAEAARAAATSETQATGTAAAAGLITTIAANHGIASSDVSWRIDGTLTRGGAIEVAVTVRFPALPVRGAPGFAWTAVHQETVDRYRSLP